MRFQTAGCIRGACLVAALLLCGQVEAAAQSSGWVRLALSPGGERTLEQRGSTVKCSYLGGLEWSAEVDMVPRMSAVTESGRAFVVGVRRESSPGQQLVDFLVVLIFDTEGNLMQRQELKRTPIGGCVLGGDPRMPWIRGLMLDEASDQAVLRLKATAGFGDWWWIYKLSTGALTSGMYPRKVIEDRPDWFNMMDARIVPEKGWYVTLWSSGLCTRRKNRRAGRPGETLVILDRRGRTLAYRDLDEYMTDPCSSIERVSAGLIELRPLEGLPLVLDMAATTKTQVELIARDR